MMALNRKTAPETRAITDLVFPRPDKIHTANGNVLYVCPRRDLGVIQMELFWTLGSAHQERTYQARTALSLALSGTAQHTAEQIQEHFEYLGAAVHSDTTLFSSHLTLKVSKKQFSNALEWLLQNYSEAVFPDEEIENYKQIEIASLQRKMHTPRYWSTRRCMETLYGYNSPMSVFANEESIISIQQQPIASFLKSKLTLGAATLFISGDAGNTEIEVIEILMAKYAPQTKTSIPLLSEEKDISYEDTHVKHRVDHTTQVSLMMGKRIPSFTEKEMHTANLTNILLGGFFGSRLMQEIREERGLTYGIGSYVSQSTDGNNWFISGEMNSSNTEAALEAIAEIMISMRNNTPTGDELDKAKRYFAGQFRSGFDGPFSLPRKIQTLLLRGYDYSYYDTTLHDLWNTTTDEICQFSDNYLHPESFTVVLAGDTKPTLDLESR